MKKFNKDKIKKFINKYLIGELLVFIALLVIDLVSKSIMQTRFENGNDSAIGIIPNFLQLKFIWNDGAAFSMLKGMTWLFILLAALASLGVCVFLYFKRKDKKFLTYTLVVLLAGTVGNLIDRIAFGKVRDFIDIIPFFNCNIADVALTVGAILLCVYYIFIDGKPKIQKIDLPEEQEQEVKKEEGPIFAFHMDNEDEEVQDFSNIKVEEEPFNMSEIKTDEEE